MARHRAVRSMNIDDEWDEDDDMYHYGHSMEENYCISPATAAQFTFNRDEHTIASYMVEPDIPEVDNETDDDEQQLDSSTGNLRKQLNDIDTARLNSCLEEIHNVLGETSSEQTITEAVLKNQFDVQASLNELLTQQGKEVPKAQRAPRQRRNRSEGDNDDDDITIFSTVSGMGDLNDTDNTVLLHNVCKTNSNHKSTSDSQPNAGLQHKISEIDNDSICMKTHDKQNNQTSKADSDKQQQTLSLSELVKLNKQAHSSSNCQSDISVIPIVPLSQLTIQNNTNAVGLNTLPLMKLSKTSGEHSFGPTNKSVAMTCSSSQKVCVSSNILLSELAKKHQSQSVRTYTQERPTGFVEKCEILSLSKLAHKHECSTSGNHLEFGSSENTSVHTKHNSSQVKGTTMTLADLAKQDSGATSLSLMEVDGESTKHKTHFDKPVGINLSLADLAKMHKPVSCISSTQSNIKSHGEKAELNSVSLSNLARSQKLGQVSPMNSIDLSISTKCIKKKLHTQPQTHSLQTDSLLLKHNSSSAERNTESKLMHGKSVLSDEQSKTIFHVDPIFSSVMKLQDNLRNRNPSTLAKALSLRCFKANKRNIYRKFPKCSYRYQTRKRKVLSVISLHHIDAFDFSTPSPDDIIQLKQKEAYNRKHDENT